MSKRLSVIFALLCASAAFGQAVRPLLQPQWFFADGNGAPCSGCSLYSYVAGTTTPLATYTDSSGTVPNQNPVIVNVNGYAAVWVSPTTAYKFVLKDAFGAVVWSADNVSSAGSSGGSGPAQPAYAVQFANPGVSGFQADPSITIDPATHTLATPNLGFADATVQTSAVNKDANGHVIAKQLATFDPKRFQMNVGDSLGTAKPNAVFLDAGNSTVFLQTNWVPAMAVGGSPFPISTRDTASSSPWSLTCDAAGNCSLSGVENSDGYFNTSQYYTLGGGSPFCLEMYSQKFTAAPATTNATLTFVSPGVATGNSPCVSLSGTSAFGRWTKQVVKCGATGQTLNGFLAGTTTDCTLTKFEDEIQQVINVGALPIIGVREYLINDIRTDAETFATALAAERTLWTRLETDFPNYPKVLVGENGLTGEASPSRILNQGTTVTSGSITAGTNTVTLANLGGLGQPPPSLGFNPGMPLLQNQPNGACNQVILDAGGGSAETICYTWVAGTTNQITFTNANSHSANFTVIATSQTAAQNFSNMLHEVARQLQGFLPDLEVVDTQEEVYGRQSPASVNSTEWNGDALHPSQSAQVLEAQAVARHLLSFSQVNTLYAAPQAAVGQFFQAVGEDGTLSPLNAITLKFTPPPLDFKFSYADASWARLQSFTACDTIKPFCDLDTNYNSVMLAGTMSGTLYNSTTITIATPEPNSTAAGNTIQTGDHICFLGFGCWTPTTLAASYINGSSTNSLELTFTGTNPYFGQMNPNIGTASQAKPINVIVTRSKCVAVGCSQYTNNPITHPYGVAGSGYQGAYFTVTAGTTGSFTLAMLYGPNLATAAQLSLQTGDIILVPGVQDAGFAINATTTCAAAGVQITCTDSSNPGYATWANKTVQVFANRAPDSNVFYETAQKLTASTIATTDLAAPTIAIVVNQTSGVGNGFSNGSTYGYKVVACNATGCSVGSSGSNQTASGTTSNMVVEFNAVAGATYYKIYGRSSLCGGTCGLLTVYPTNNTSTPLTQFPASLCNRTNNTQCFAYDMDASVSPGTAIATVDTSFGQMAPHQFLFPFAVAPSGVCAVNNAIAYAQDGSWTKCSAGTWAAMAVPGLPLVAALTTTAATTDNVTVTGMTASGHCSLTATNVSAATSIATTYVSAKTTNQITVTHAVTASMTYDVICTSY